MTQTTFTIGQKRSAHPTDEPQTVHPSRRRPSVLAHSIAATEDSYVQQGGALGLSLGAHAAVARNGLPPAETPSAVRSAPRTPLYAPSVQVAHPWRQVAALFAPQSPFLEIVLEGTQLDDWMQLIAALRASNYPFEMHGLGTTPQRDDLLRTRLFAKGTYVELVVCVGQSPLRCCLLEPSSMAFDLACYRGNDERSCNELLQFMAFLSGATGKLPLIVDGEPPR